MAPRAGSTSLPAKARRGRPREPRCEQSAIDTQLYLQSGGLDWLRSGRGSALPSADRETILKYATALCLGLTAIVLAACASSPASAPTASIVLRCGSAAPVANIAELFLNMREPRTVVL